MDLEMLHDGFFQRKRGRNSGRTTLALVTMLQQVDFGIRRAWYWVPELAWSRWLIPTALNLAVYLGYELVGRSSHWIDIRNEHGYVMRFQLFSRPEEIQGSSGPETISEDEKRFAFEDKGGERE